MQPASTIKVVTTLVALEQLGPAFRGRTELRTNAPIRQGVLEGDVVLRLARKDQRLYSDIVARRHRQLANLMGLTARLELA